MNRQKIIIDTDPGIDDAMAILFAMACSEIDVVGLTSVFGNVPVEMATRNALVLAEMGRHAITVSEGAADPLKIAPSPATHHIHGDEGFGDLPAIHPKGHASPLTSAEHLVAACKADPGNITICAIGPLTNLAQALQLEPQIAHWVKDVIIMGGAVQHRGNITEYAEANIWNDPHAAAVVFDASWPVTLIGLDVTSKILCTPEGFAELAQNAPRIGGFINDIAQFYLEFYQREVGVRGCRMHDPAVIVAAIRPELFTFEDAPISVSQEGEQIGQTYIDPGNPQANTRFAAAVDDKAALDLFLSTLSNDIA